MATAVDAVPRRCCRAHGHVPASPSSEHLVIRPIRSSDARALERFYAELDPDSRRARFFAMTSGVSHRQAVSFCTPDHDHREGFVAEALGSVHARRRIVGHLCIEPLDARTAEVAIAVADGYRGRGIGRRLMVAGVEWARAAGIAAFTATMFATNLPIQRLLRGLHLPVRVGYPEPDLSSITIDLTPPSPIAA
jgi:acetyltransferase